MLVVDLLHEFELGVWKDLFMHLLRILASVNPGLVNELDSRYVKLICCSRHCTDDYSIIVTDRYLLLAETLSEGSRQMFLSLKNWLQETLRTFCR